MGNKCWKWCFEADCNHRRCGGAGSFHNDDIVTIRES